MAKWVDFDAIHEAVKFAQVLEHYSLMENAKTSGSEIKIPCPFHDNDSKPSLSINTEKNIFHCFGCDAKGDLIQFVVLKEGINTGNRDNDRRKAALLITDWFGIKSKRPAQRGRARQNKTVEPQAEERPETSEQEQASAAAGTAEVVNPPLQYALKNLDPTHPYLEARGIKRETAEYFELGYHGGRGIMAGRIAIPLHSSEGVLIGYLGRWPGDDGWPEGEGKYKVPSGIKMSHVLYNIYRARENAGEGLIVTESAFDLFTLWQRGRKNIVSTLGCHMSAEQEQLIVETVGPKGRVLIMYDPDEPGLKGARAAAERLMSRCFVRLLEPGN